MKSAHALTLIGLTVLWISSRTGDEAPLCPEAAIVTAEHDDGTVDLRVLKSGGGHANIGSFDVEKIRVSKAEDPSHPTRGSWVLREEYVPGKKPAKKKAAKAEAKAAEKEATA